MNKCQSCGTLVPEDQAFCFNCGASMLPEEKNKRSGSFIDMQSTMLPPEDFDPQMPLRPRTDAATPAPPVSPAPPPPVIEKEPVATKEPETPAIRNAPSVKAYNASNVAPTATPGVKSNTGFYVALGAGFALMFFFLLLLIVVLYFFFFSN